MGNVFRVLVVVFALLAAVVGSVAPPASARDGVLVSGCSGVRPTIVGTAGDDTLTGTRGRDVIVGKGGDDVVRGLGGDDMICVGEGNDRAYGGAGMDFVIGGPGGDALDGQGGMDLVSGGGGRDALSSARGADLLEGGRGDDWLEVTSPLGVMMLDAGGGADVASVELPEMGGLGLRGGGGVDQLELFVTGEVAGAEGAADDGQVRLNQPSGSMLVWGARSELSGWEASVLSGEVDWVYHGTGVDESLLVRGGTLTAFMNGGSDNVSASGDGDSYVNLGVGEIESAETGAGDDVLIGGPGIDLLDGGAGDDILDGGTSLSDELRGDDGTDIGRDVDGAAVCLGLEFMPEGCTL